MLKAGKFTRALGKCTRARPGDDPGPGPDVQIWASAACREVTMAERSRALGSDQMTVMFSACRPFWPWVTSKETCWFSSSER